MFSASMKEHVGQLYTSIQALLGEHELAWCPPSVSMKSNPAIPLEDIPAGVSLDSEEYLQIVRVRLRADDMVAFAGRNLDAIQSDLDGSDLVRLFWSIALLRLYDETLVTVVQSKLRASNMESLSVDETIMLLWAEAMLLGSESSLVQVELAAHVDSLTVPQLSNLVFARCLVSGGDEFSKSTGEALAQKISGITSPALLRYACRAVAFATGAVDPLVTAVLRKTPATLPAWKYSFQLWLASHGAASRGIDFNPLVEHMFPFDVMYTSSRSSSSKRRTRFLLEIQRPTSVIRELGSGRIINVDGYTKLVRMHLAKTKKAYRILPISISEWVALGGDFERQVAYVRMRIRNSLNKKRLFSGTEKDENFENPSDNDDNDERNNDSDMSY